MAEVKAMVRKERTEEEMKQVIHDIVWNTPAGEGIKMFDDWNEPAPDFCNNVIPVGEDGDIYDYSDDESESDGRS